MSYFGDILKGIKTTRKGMSLTWKHLWDARKTRGAMNVNDETYFRFTEGHVTLQYPHQKLDVPDNGRYQLDCEIDDCIVCDKCAKVCPVDCIEIEAIKSPELIRTTSDGSPVRLHAAKFDIDMAKCCFCGLCTTVCPTECLTMNSEYDFSVWDVNEFNFEFANLSPEEADEKRKLYDQFVAEKEALKAEKSVPTANQPAEQSVKRPAFVPKMKPPTVASPETPNVETEKPKPVLPFRPKMSPPKPVENEEKASSAPQKPAFKPTIKPPTTGFKPTIKPPKIDGDNQ